MIYVILVLLLSLMLLGPILILGSILLSLTIEIIYGIIDLLI